MLAFFLNVRRGSVLAAIVLRGWRLAPTQDLPMAEAFPG